MPSKSDYKGYAKDDIKNDVLSLDADADEDDNLGHANTEVYEDQNEESDDDDDDSSDNSSNDSSDDDSSDNSSNDSSDDDSNDSRDAYLVYEDDNADAHEDDNNDGNGNGDDCNYEANEENDTRIVPINKVMEDGHEEKLTEFELTCSGYYSFAEQIKRCYLDTPSDRLPMVLWPWPGYRFEYMRKKLGESKSMDPLSTRWAKFKEKVDRVLVMVNEYGESDLACVSFIVGNVLVHTCPNRREYVKDRKSFERILSFIYSSWIQQEPPFRANRDITYQDNTSYADCESRLLFLARPDYDSSEESVGEDSSEESIGEDEDDVDVDDDMSEEHDRDDHNNDDEDTYDSDMNLDESEQEDALNATPGLDDDEDIYVSDVSLDELEQEDALTAIPGLDVSDNTMQPSEEEDEGDDVNDKVFADFFAKLETVLIIMD